MIQKLFVAAIAAASTLIPVGAEVQPGTSSLLDTLSNNGIVVTYNHPECATNGSHGQYRWAGFKREMRLCPGATVDAIDHSTVRHETLHAIQHCVNIGRGTHINTPIVHNREEFSGFINTNLTESNIDTILELYPKEQWGVELEAFAGANAFTSAELRDLFLSACVAPNQS